ncbi:hypothetical protein ES703_121647 [subsurface metagenome]
MGISFKEAPILISARVTLIGITNHIFSITFGIAAGFPLPPRGKATATPASQTRPFYLLNDILWRHLEEGFAQGGITPHSDVVFNVCRVNFSVGAKNSSCLPLIEWNLRFIDNFLVCYRVHIEQPLNDVAVEYSFGDNLWDILRLNPLIEDPLWSNDYHWSPFTETVAPRFL